MKTIRLKGHPSYENRQLCVNPPATVASTSTAAVFDRAAIVNSHSLEFVLMYMHHDGHECIGSLNPAGLSANQVQNLVETLNRYRGAGKLMRDIEVEDIPISDDE